MENVTPAGLWFGGSKPNTTVFLKPAFTALMKLEQDGVEVRSPLHACQFVSKVILQAGTCDLPAKCLVLNTI